MIDAAPAEDTTLGVLVRAIVSAADPEIILLVGSRAYGVPRDDSDYDVMLVLTDGANVAEARDAAWDASRKAGIPTDVLARTVTEYERRRDDPGFIDYLAARSGVVLYTTGMVPQRTPPSSRVREEPREGLAMWLRKAESDLRVAELSIESAIPVWDAVCFHSHACVEKLFKAWIVHGGTHPPRTHRLAELLARMPAAVRDDPGVIEGCSLLERLYPGSRYPDAAQRTLEEARQAIDFTRGVRELMRRRIPEAGG